MSQPPPTSGSPNAFQRRRRGTVLAITLFASAVTGLWLAAEWLWIRPTERFVVTTLVDGVPRETPIDAFLPPAGSSTSGQNPAVVLLHGVEGAARYRSAHYRTARWLARRGYAVFFIHYFRGGGYDDLWQIREDGNLDLEAIDAACRQDAARWTRVVAESLNAIAGRPDIDRSRIALDGNSLGGFVALSAATAAIQDDRVADPCAVVINWGGLFENTKPPHGFPPTLFIHGEKDTVVPLDAARHAAESVLAVQSEASLFIVPGAPHVARSAESDAVTLQFLEKHLGAGRRVDDPIGLDETHIRESVIESNAWPMSSPLLR